MRRSLSGSVMVITGASSGIGRCTASYCAARGAKVILTARRQDALEKLAREIRRDGGVAVPIQGDVTSEDDMRAVAELALRRFGRIDTWVNNAGVFLQGRVQDITLNEYRRLLEVNFLGVVNGTKRALEAMLPRGSGVIIQISSVAAKRGVPYTSPYSAAKAAIDGFTDAIRAELRGTGVKLSILYPPPVDTPIYDHGRGKLSTGPKPAPPVADPVQAAREIARLATTGAPRAYFSWSRPLVLLDTLSPSLADWILHHSRGFTYGSTPSEGDNLYTPSRTIPASVRAGWRRRGWRGLTPGEFTRVLPLETAIIAIASAAVSIRLIRRLIPYFLHNSLIEVHPSRASRTKRARSSMGQVSPHAIEHLR